MNVEAFHFEGGVLSVKGKKEKLEDAEIGSSFRTVTCDGDEDNIVTLELIGGNKKVVLVMTEVQSILVQDMLSVVGEEDSLMGETLTMTQDE